MAENIQAVTDGNFEAEVLTASNSKPVMVDFWAEWCRPCHMLAPTVAEIAHDYEGKLKVMKLNVDEAINSAGRYNIRGIPTLLVFKNGQVVEQIVGAVPKDQITKALERHIGLFRDRRSWKRVVEWNTARFFICAGRGGNRESGEKNWRQRNQRQQPQEPSSRRTIRRCSPGTAGRRECRGRGCTKRCCRFCKACHAGRY